MTLDALLAVDKPSGPTSHDVVAEVRRLAGQRRVGHTGTLDPFATGVLPLCLGRATRLSRFMAGSRKVYEATLKLGLDTDTYDALGRPVRQRDASGISAAQVREAALRFAGEIDQVPPPYSARRIAGKRLHELARSGRPVLLPASRVTIHRLEISDVDGPLVHFVTEVSAGTYIRSLARDIGEALGCGAHLAALRRTSAGRITLDQAHDMDEVRAAAAAGTLTDLMVTIDRIDLGLPTAVANAIGAEAVRNGRPLASEHLCEWPAEPIAAGGPVRVVDGAGRLLSVAMAGAGASGALSLHPSVVLYSPSEG
ncbi:MAG: tRNA pseudouridine(55) synthase TruB [Candidatus Polarisedimenticolia bacterium]